MTVRSNSERYADYTIFIFFLIYIKQIYLQTWGLLLWMRAFPLDGCSPVPTYPVLADSPCPGLKQYTTITLNGQSKLSDTRTPNMCSVHCGISRFPKLSVYTPGHLNFHKLCNVHNMIYLHVYLYSLLKHKTYTSWSLSQ